MSHRDEMMEKFNVLIEHFPQLARSQTTTLGLSISQIRAAVYNGMIYVDNSGQFQITALYTISIIKQSMKVEK